MARKGMIDMVDPASNAGSPVIVEMWPVDAKHAASCGWKSLEQVNKEAADEAATEKAAERVAAKMKSTAKE